MCSSDLIRKKLPDLQIIFLPHHIDSKFFKNWKLDKKYDILMYGNTSLSFYPFRNRIYKLLKNNTDKFNIKFQEPIRNYFKFNPKISNKSLSTLINQSWITICTPSKFDLLLGKYFETSMSFSAVCGNLPKDAFPIWSKCFINIDNTMTDEQIIKTISNALNDKKNINKICSIMYKKMEEFYLDKFADKLAFNVKKYIL